MRATGTFELDSWDEHAYDEREGARLTRTTITKTFRGDIEGTSTGEMLMARSVEEGAAAYAGFERVTGRLHGRPGSFVLHHDASMSGGTQSASVVVLPGSGTGELRGLRGGMRIDAGPDGHAFTFEYELG